MYVCILSVTRDRRTTVSLMHKRGGHGKTAAASPPARPHPSCILFLSDFKDIARMRTNMGSSKLYTATYKRNNEVYVIKQVIKKSRHGEPRTNTHGVYDIQLAVNELLASVVYRDVYHVDAIKLYMVVNNMTHESSLQKYMLASRKLEYIHECDRRSTSKMCIDLYNNRVPGATKHFLVDCILANWDVGAPGNIAITYAVNKAAYRMDVGGAILYRARGAPRDCFSEIPREHETFFSPKNISYRLFKSLSPQDVDDMFDVINAPQFPGDFDAVIKMLKMDVNTQIKDEDDVHMAIKNLDESIDIIKKRHIWYIGNTNEVETFLFSKVRPKKRPSVRHRPIADLIRRSSSCVMHTSPRHILSLLGNARLSLPIARGTKDR